MHAADEFLRVAGDIVTGRKSRAGAAARTTLTPGDELTEVLGSRPELDELLAAEAVESPERAQGRPGNVA